MEVCSKAMKAGSIVEFIWIGGPVLQLLLAGVLVYRKSWTTFPLFTSYALFNLADAVVALGSRANPPVYFYVYWIGEAIGIVLGFLVVYEVFKNIFIYHSALRKLAKLIFAISLFALVSLAVFILLHAGPRLTGNISRSVMVLEEATRTIEVGLLVVLFMCAGAFGLHWRQSVFGIALGLGIFVSVELVAVTMRSQLSPATHNAFAIVRAFAYITSLVVWGTYMLLPERAPDESQLPERGQLEQWNQAILELIHQ
jgi:hypothetical protein